MAFPVEEKYIEIAEKDLNARFPESFRIKMMELNGGEVEVDEDFFELHPFYDTSDKKRLKRTCNSIFHETNMARNHYGLPDNLVVIGNNGGGDMLVYKVEEAGKLGQKVYVLDHENDDLNVAAQDFSELCENV